MRIRIRIPQRRRPAPGRLYRRGLLAAVVFCVGSTTYGLVGDGGLVTVLQMRARHAQLAQQVAAAELANQALRQQIAALRSDPRELERLAREELQMARPGETIYLLPPSRPQPAEPRPEGWEELEPGTPSAPSLPHRR